MRRYWALLLVGVMLLTVLPAAAQVTPAALWEVYLVREAADLPDGSARLMFIDPVTGDVQAVDVRGEAFTPVGGYVLYRDAESGQPLRAWPDGRTEPHPFIVPTPETVRVDWVVSPDGQAIAWTLTNRDAAGSLTTITTRATADGGDLRVLLTDGPDAFLQVVPLALTDDGLFFFDRQPQGAGGYFFFPQYAAVHQMDTTAADLTPELLPFEPNCFCGAGIAANGRYFARLERLSDAGGYDIRVWDLAAGVDVFAPSLPASYETAGAVLVSPDGRRAVYSLANNLTLDSAGGGSERFMLALFDAESGEQRALLYNPLLVPLLPLRWTEDGSGVLLYNPRADGTWKLTLATGELRQVAAGRLLGTIQD